VIYAIFIRMTIAENQNASQFPRTFYARHMQPGTCGYEDEIVLVDTDAIKKMIPTGVNKPIYIHHQNVNLDSIKEDADGWITESFYNELDGWAWFKCIAIDDAAHKAIDNGWSVSNAYRPTQFGVGGTKNNCPFNREVLNAEFTHLAIVPNPRYEEACIMSPEQFRNYQEAKRKELENTRILHNSNPTKGNAIMKFFKFKKEEVSTVDNDTMVEIDGKTISVVEMLNAVKKNEEEEEKKAKEKINEDDMIECDGEKMPLKELMNRYKKMNEKKNAEEKEEEKKKKEKDEAEKKENESKNAEEEEKKKKSEEDKENSKFYAELMNAHNTAQKTETPVEAPQNKMIRGKKRYGSAE